MDSRRTKIVVVVGSTASGKTQLGIDLAKRFDGEVISVDSRLVYKGMDIGTAKPNGEWKMQGEKWQLGHGLPMALMVDGVPHWGIDLVEPDMEYNVADFKKYADEKIKEIERRGSLPILVGGTGLWVRAVVDNLSLTETPPNWELRAKLETRSPDDLFAEYKRLDPDGAELIDRQNKRRVVRALEVTLSTNKPFSQQVQRGNGRYDVLELGIAVERDTLNERINLRVDEMVAMGLVNEVRGLRDRYGCASEAMTGIGYRQICRWLASKSRMGAEDQGPMQLISLADAIEEIKKATRTYAKRQMTWFKRDDRIRWIRSSEEAFDLVTRFRA